MIFPFTADVVFETALGEVSPPASTSVYLYSYAVEEGTPRLPPQLEQLSEDVGAGRAVVLAPWLLTSW
jgi:hypothetical protein